LGAWVDLKAATAMTTRWRRRQVCTLAGLPAIIRTLSATAIVLESDARPALGDTVTLHHPEAGTITGRVDAHHENGVALCLAGDVNAVAFALAATAADMSRP